MIILGIIVMAGTATLCGLLIADNFSAAPLIAPHLLGHTLPSVSAAAVFCAGLWLGLLFCLGAWMIAARVIDRRRHPRWGEPVEELLPGRWRTS